MYRGNNSRKIVFLLNYRAGSTFFECLLGKPWRFLQAQGKTEECTQIYQAWRISNLPFLLPSVELCPCEDNFNLLFQPIQEEFPFFAWTLHVGDWWGILKANQVPEPYEIETPSRYAVNDLKNLPGNNWIFITLVRDGRNQISSLFNFKGGIEEKRKHADPMDYFEALCKAWRNKSRIAIDCSKQMENYYIIKFEELIRDPLVVMNKIFTLSGLSLEIDKVKYYLTTYRGEVHSSFQSNLNVNTRWDNWTEWQKDIFYEIAGKELCELGYIR